jgi:hypothetical protein
VPNRQVGRTPDTNRNEHSGADRPAVREGSSNRGERSSGSSRNSGNRGERSSGGSGGRSEGRGRR